MSNCCPRCNREVYFAERKLALGRVWHTFCFSCLKCRKLLDACSVNTYCGELYCNACFNSICNPCQPSPCKPCRPRSPCDEVCDCDEDCRPIPCVQLSCDPCGPCCAPGNPRCRPVNRPCCKPYCRPSCYRPKRSKSCCKPNPCCKPTPCCQPNCARDICNPCCRPLPCKPCCDPCCACCGKPQPCCCCPRPSTTR